MAIGRHCCYLQLLLCLTFSFSSNANDDSAIMLKLSASIAPTPPSWKTNNNSFCNWEGISCDNFNRVTNISLSNKLLNGTLPSDLNNLSQLKILDLSGNSLSGALPTLANLTLLEDVRLLVNNFTSIPFNFFLGLTNLQYFSISYNFDLAPWILPYDLSQCTNLRTFAAHEANLIGSIPDIFNNLPNLEVLRLSNNSLNGTLPSSLNNLSKLKKLDLTFNSLSGNIIGSIPDIFDSFLSLQDLRLSNNNLTGKLPVSFGRSKIRYLYLDNQLPGLSGTLDVISEMTQLRILWLQANAFTGAIPNLSKFTNLEDLQLRDNQLTGLVPDSLISLSSLPKITLQNNRLQGPLPVFARDVESWLDNNSFCLPTPGKCDPQVTALLEVAASLGYPMSLASSWQGNDACRDWSFVTCDSSGKNVTSVNFGKQNFSGTISPSFANLTSLRNLSLNENNLTGSIPEVLKSLPHLQFLDVSNNNLSGLIPEFQDNVTFLHSNNPFLGKHSNRQSVGMVIGVVISALIFVGIIVAFVSYKCYRVPRKLHIQTTKNHGEIPISENRSLTISIQLLEKVTDSFSDENVLGRGGFGIVYKGELHDGTKIAVKRMQSDVKGTQGIKEFHAEIEVLTKVRHKHLVALHGFCISGIERLLVYEHMPQGTLSQHLFKWREYKSPPLSWKQRVSIALDVGRGVEYLHRLAQQTFIHRDLKPANILLDDDMRAKVADFGLVKNAPNGKYSVETRLAGTFGYLAPEYAATGRVTTKVDVFAFGVVLMQLITGRKALDGSKSDERYSLVTWFRKVPVCKENMIRFRDQVLDTDDCETLESILKVAELARHCTASQPFQRPDMGYVVSVLCHLVEKWKPSEEKTYSHQHHKSLPEVLLLEDDDDTSRMFNVFRLNTF